MSAKQTGTVKWFDPKRGYGFITADNGEDVFVHFTGIKAEGYRKLNESNRVEFDIENDENTNRTIAKNVVKLA